LIISEAEIHSLLERFELALEDTTAWISTWLD